MKFIYPVSHLSPPDFEKCSFSVLSKSGVTDTQRSAAAMLPLKKAYASFPVCRISSGKSICKKRDLQNISLKRYFYLSKLLMFCRPPDDSIMQSIPLQGGPISDFSHSVPSNPVHQQTLGYSRRLQGLTETPCLLPA